MHTIHVTERDKNERDIQNSSVSTVHWNDCIQSVTPLIDLFMSSWTRLSQQMRTLSSRSSKMGSGVRYTLCCRAHDTRGHAGNFLDFARTFAGDGIVFLLHISSETRQILCCVRTDHGHPLPAFRLTVSVLSIFHKRLLTELSTHFFQRNSKQIHLAPYHFSCLNSLINVTSL